ncbi:S1/P1 nuclease [Singulisphaera acidiphila]|uniref:S1/P1 Nuclease n=1 Tax=Singulisphaera acidiphila (strain ATCC BAA-1392 / DSM 18658 / VKM B-2454 / MOB10) TaxID=886293 RepID=L0DI11_SINAD|nr:S1/P1 nuclease [Singulisphaera acidiphila]AGA28443.1 S1/P1 Nuclease [Singulisphaera acidiphila DSM 18658]
MRRIALTFAALVFLALPAYAWNKPGHMVTGAIAYAELKKNDPATLAKVVAILKKHPDINRWNDLINRLEIAPEDRDLFLFMQAARWPDDARGTTYDRPSHHFVNIPLKPGATGSPAIPVGDSILVAFDENMATLADNDASDSEKAVALCWIFHLVGDVHQPLHSVKLVTAQFPDPIGDRGGTRFFIKPKANGGTISLHQLWDGLIIGSQNFQTVRNTATELRERTGLQRSDLSEIAEKDFLKWCSVESFDTARDVAYSDGNGGPLQGGSTKPQAEVLPNGYLDKAKAAAERRVILAGYRLADLLGANLD